MSVFDDLKEKRIKKDVKFMGAKVTISKMTVEEVMFIQEQAKEAKDDEEKSFELVLDVIRTCAEGAKEFSKSDFDGFPLDELSKLSKEIMVYSGLAEGK